MDTQSAPQQRELVYCHQCDNEWYRDEHGIICPECESDFTEIIEDPTRDPRVDDLDDYPPDPDEGDIEDLQPHGPGQPAGGSVHATFTGNWGTNNQNTQGLGTSAGILGGSLMGMLAPTLQGLMGAPNQQQQDPQHQGQEQNTNTHGPTTWTNWQTPGSHHQGQQQQQSQQNGNTFVRQGHGPGYSYSITSTTSSNITPRDAFSPQPFHFTPSHLDEILNRTMHMFVMPFDEGDGQAHPMEGREGIVPLGSVSNEAAGRPGQGSLRFFGIRNDRPLGDAVFSQEGMDRVISELMEQHQPSNAPPPASSQAIESLQKRPVTPKDVGDNGTADCSICMEEVEIGSTITELPCGHWFHHECIRAWLNEHDTCPHCRQGIMPKDQPGTSSARQPDQAPQHHVHQPVQRARFGPFGVPLGVPIPIPNDYTSDIASLFPSGFSGGMPGEMPGEMPGGMPGGMPGAFPGGSPTGTPSSRPDSSSVPTVSAESGGPWPARVLGGDIARLRLTAADYANLSPGMRETLHARAAAFGRPFYGSANRADGQPYASDTRSNDDHRPSTDQSNPGR